MRDGGGECVVEGGFIIFLMITCLNIEYNFLEKGEVVRNEFIGIGKGILVGIDSIYYCLFCSLRIVWGFW